LVGDDGDKHWQKTEDALYYLQGNLGIGIQSPQKALQVKGVILGDDVCSGSVCLSDLQSTLDSLTQDTKIDFSIDKTFAKLNEKFNIFWQISNKNNSTCSISGLEFKAIDIASIGSLALARSEEGIYLFTLTCEKGKLSTSKHVEVNVYENEKPVNPNEKRLDFYSSAVSIVKGESVTLGWSGTNIDFSTCVTGGWNANISGEGTKILALENAGSHIFNLTCSNITKSLSVTAKNEDGKPIDPTLLDPILIKTCKEFSEIKTEFNALYKLENDIDCLESKLWSHGEQEGFPIIGDEEHFFTGILDGNNKTIKNVFIKNPDFDFEKGRAGLFYGLSETGVIKNMKMENFEVSAWGSYGGLVLINNGRIEDVSISACSFTTHTGSIAALALNSTGSVENIRVEKIEILGAMGISSGLMIHNSGPVRNINLTEVEIEGTGTLVGIMSTSMNATVENIVMNKTNLIGKLFVYGIMEESTGIVQHIKIQESNFKALGPRSGPARLVYGVMTKNTGLVYNVSISKSVIMAQGNSGSSYSYITGMIYNNYGTADMLAMDTTSLYWDDLDKNVNSLDLKTYIGGLVYNNYNNGTLSNSRVNDCSMSGRNLGGISYTSYGMIANCTVNNTDFTSRYLGGAVQNQYGTLQYSSVVGGKFKGQYVGGLVYYGNDASFNYRCFTDIDFQFYKAEQIGGLIRTLSAKGIISECFTKGYVLGNSYAGGLLYHCPGCTISNSYSTAYVKAASYAGGLVGNSNNVKIEYSYSSGSRTGHSKGLVGYESTNKLKAYRSFYYGSHITYRVGDPLNKDQLQSHLSFANAHWDFKKTWAIHEENSTPFLQWENH
jgi:hypothetical protein